VWAIEEGRKAADAVDSYLEQLGDREDTATRNAAA
jgi:hypothetical protein